MLLAPAPRLPGGPTRVLLMLGLLLVDVGFLRAQEPKKKAAPAPAAIKSAATKDQRKDQAEPDEEAQASLADTQLAGQAELEERYQDPNALKAVANTFPELPGPALLTETQNRQVGEMAAGRATVDRNLLNNYIRYQLAQLTLRRNIDAMLNSSASSAGVIQMQEAGNRLLRPVLDARAANNRAFLGEYTRLLVAQAPQVLSNHLYARVFYMVALSRTGDAQALPVFEQVLADPNQVLTVKILAAVGINNLTQEGRIDINPAEAIRAAKALAAYLGRERDGFWPARMRALQALGSLRLGHTDPLRPEVTDLAAVALGHLADPAAHPAIRAAAARALGMFRVSSQAARYNVPLVAYHMASAAADIGDLVVTLDETNPERARRMTDLLIQILLGFDGEPGVLNSGLLNSSHPTLTQRRAAIQALRDRIRDIARAGIELNRSAAAQRPETRQATAAAVQALREALVAATPENWALYPGGPEFPANTAAPPAEPATEPSSPDRAPARATPRASASAR